MPTPEIAVPGARAAGGPQRRRAIGLRRIVCGPATAPAWSRPALIGVAGLAGVLMVWGLTVSGDANTYYAAAGQAASQSWRAMFFDAADLSGYVSLDKGPLPDVMIGLSGRIFGFSSLSMLLPEAICGVVSVVLLHDLVRRVVGHRAAIAAAGMLALTPVTVLVSRYNNPDALLAVLLVAAAWALVRALETDRLRDLVLSAVLLGLAFNTKMLEAYVVVPALAITFVVAGRGRLRRRLGRLSVAGGVLGLVSFAWYATMMLIPAADRPYVGDTTHNSWFQLIFGENGFARVTGRSGGPGGGLGGGGFAGGFGRGMGGAAGPLRLFDSQIGGQIAWLLPVAMIGLVYGLWTRRAQPRTDRTRAAYLLLGLWAVTGWAVLSFSGGIFHAYYTSVIAPPVAGLAGAGLVGLAGGARRHVRVAGVLAAAVAATGWLAFTLLGDAPGFVGWLRWVVLGAGGLAGVAVLASQIHRPSVRRLTGWLAALATGIAVLGGPSAYAIATLGHGQSGSDPTAGPVVGGGGRGGFAFVGGGRGGGSGAVFGRRGPAAGPQAQRGSAGGLRRGSPIGATGGPVDPGLVSYLEAHRDGARYLVAATGSQIAGPIELATGEPVITMGGFMGADPAPSVAQLAGLVGDGQLRYVLVGGGGGGFGGGGRGGGAFGGGRSASVSSARQTWVTGHCKAVDYGSGSSGGRGGVSLYSCSAADI
jgi:4-amino-4-deoxy-L-arabinose transferase-like glycosyltransferase